VSKKVVAVTLGGTIAMPAVPGSELLGPDELLASVTVAGVDVISDDFLRVPSSHLSFSQLFALRDRIERHFEEGRDGVVVVQGTDTLEETAWFLDLTLRVDAPVAVTGAMRKAEAPGSDGPANLVAAVTAVASPVLEGMGVVVAFNDEIHAARDVCKVHSVSTRAFCSPNFGPIGYVHEGRVRVDRRATSSRHVDVPADADAPRVPLYVFTLDDEAGESIGALGTGAAGLVVAASGVGHISPDGADVIGELVEAGKPVVLCSRTGAGPSLHNTYDYVGSESDLLSRGAISAGYLHPYKARILLRLLLQSGADVDEVRRVFSTF
jgi:L-asparaginase